MTTISDLAKACPLAYWVGEHKHTIRVELVTGQSLIFRSDIQGFKQFKCNRHMLRNGTPWLQDKSDDVIDALIDLVDAEVLQLAERQVVIARQAATILQRITQGDSKNAITLIAQMVLILEEYEPTADLSDWRKWLENCLFFCYTLPM